MFCISVVPPTSQPFARSRRARGTTAGIMAWLAERKTISPVLIRNSATSSRAMLDHPASSAVASTPMTATRIQSIVTICRRRSTRSTSTPPGRANSSQGSHATPVVAETISGLLVCTATKSGAAIVARPLPRAEVVLAVHSFANREPSGSATSSDATWVPQRYVPVPAQRRGEAPPQAGLAASCARRDPASSGRRARVARATSLGLACTGGGGGRAEAWARRYGPEGFCAVAGQRAQHAAYRRAVGQPVHQDP